MTAAIDSNPEAIRPELTEPVTGGLPPGRRGATSLRIGVATLWLSVIVLLPLAAIVWQSAKGGWAAFVSAVTSPSALESFRVTLTISSVVTVINVVFGTLVAWVLVRDDFPGKRLVDAVIDLPFALPTIVASVVLLALYGPNSPVGIHLQHTAYGVGVALLFVTLPFVVRAVQPVLMEVDLESEQAAASLGANNSTIFTNGDPSGADTRAVVRWRAGVLPRDRRVRLGRPDRRCGAREDRGVVAVDPHSDRERRPCRRRSGFDCAAGHVIRGLVHPAGVWRPGCQARGVGEVTPTPPLKYLMRFVALAYIGVLVIVPAGLILWRSFSPGLGQFFSQISTPAAISALQLSLLVVAIVVPLNVLFGVPTALVLARSRFRGKGVLQAVIDLPFAVSPVVVGVALIVLWGSAGALGFVERDLGFKIIFGLPGIVLASIFVTLPFVIREVEPVLHEIGTDQEEAAATLGSRSWQTFWRITLPSIRWGLMYGVVLTVARTLGEYGAVIMVSSNLPGKSQTLTLLVSDRYSRGAEYGAYAVSTLLMTVAVLVLIVQVILDARRARARA